jgi:hypothetical protein
MSAKAEQITQTTKEALLNCLEKASKDFEIAALTQKEEKVLYDIVSDMKDILFEYHPTVLSPKKFFFPKEEVILEYTADGKVSVKNESAPMVLFGIRPCDINGIKILNEAFAESNGDPNYMAKQEKSIVIGLDCAEICHEHAFCYKVKSNFASTGCDIMLHPMNGNFLVKAITKKGEEFSKKYLNPGFPRRKNLQRF